MMAREMPVALAGSVAPQQSPPNTKIPQFLQKLYNIVDSPATNDVICWSEAGNSFYVLDHERLAKELLGNWFKHTNFPSFVRQLNMYGFKKVPDLQQGVMNSDGRTEHHQFAHEHFLRGQRHLLAYIDRKKGNHAKNQPQNAITFDSAQALPAPSAVAGQLDMNTIISGITAIRRHQTAITTELNELKQSNRALWQESMEARARHQKQQDTINRIVKFLAGVFGHSTNTATKDGDITSNSHSPMPMPTSRLMIEDRKKEPQKQSVGITEVDENPNGLFARDTSPLSSRFVAVETPASTAEPPSPAMTDATTFPPTPSVESVPFPAPADTTNDVIPTPSDTARPVSPGLLSPKIDLSAFSPGDLSQFLSSLILPMPDGTGNTEGTQAITPYQSFDLGSYSPPPLALPSPQSLSSTNNTDELLAFPHELQHQWKQTADIDKEVKESSDGIATLLDTFKTYGIDPSQFDGPSLLDPSQTFVNTSGGAPVVPGTDDTSFFDSFLNNFSAAPTPTAPTEDMDADGDATALLDEVPSPATLPLAAEPSEVLSPIPDDFISDSPPLKNTRGRKRKSDVANTKQTESAMSARPKRRKER